MVAMNRKGNRPSLDKLKDAKDLVGMEIGVQGGFNAEWMLKNLDIKKLYLIDPYREYRCNNGRAFDDGGLYPEMPEVRKAATKLLKPYADKIEQIFEKSWDVLDIFDSQSLDFIYVDGNHIEKAVYGDMAFISKIKLGGLFCGHDWKVLDVRTAIRNFVQDNGIEINCCGKRQIIPTLSIENCGVDWWIWVPTKGKIFTQKCSMCQRVHSYPLNKVKWIK